MISFFTYLRGWLVAGITCTILATFISTQRVIGGLSDAGATVGLTERLSMSVYDILHFGTLYGLFIFAAFLVAFLAGGLVFGWTRFGRGIIYSAAGGSAMLVMLLLMQMVFFGVPIVGGAREGVGLGLQMFAGGIGGYVFHRLTHSRARY